MWSTKKLIDKQAQFWVLMAKGWTRKHHFVIPAVIAHRTPIVKSGENPVPIGDGDVR